MKFAMIIVFLFLLAMSSVYSLNDARNDYQFRLGLMRKLQKNHSWYPGDNERMSDKFLTKGKRSNDSFISYLGFLRDSSEKVNKSLLTKKVQRFMK